MKPCFNPKAVEARMVWNSATARFDAAKKSMSTGSGFIKGPLPLAWMHQAAKLPGKTLHVALALWYLSGLQKAKTVRLTAKSLTAMGVSRDAKYDALARLAHAGLVAVEQAPGKVPVVTLIDVP